MKCLIENKKHKKEFKPITLQIEIESKRELMEFEARITLSLKQVLQAMYNIPLHSKLELYEDFMHKFRKHSISNAYPTSCLSGIGILRVGLSQYADKDSVNQWSK